MLEFSSPGRAVTMSKELRSKGPITWNTNLAIGMSNISTNGYWSSVTPPENVLSSIIEDMTSTNGLVRYNTDEMTVEEKRWWSGGYTATANCKKDRLRELYGTAVEHTNVLRTELTQMNRTADLFQKRNSALQEELTSVKRQLNESERMTGARSRRTRRSRRS